VPRELSQVKGQRYQALDAFLQSLKANSLDLPAAAHFTETGASDAIFVAAAFDKPFVFQEMTVASKVRAMEAMQRLAETLDFGLPSEPEPESAEDQWLPLATVKNIARIISGYFDEEPDACVAYT